ncbi:MAG: FAD-dependent oxidoreductase [Phycisphaerae bacterium]|nr:FAD-dependent oxidoreductase [Phycisphaerae bacterium]
MRTVEQDVDVCVVGGGLAGLCAAVAAARRGAEVALVHDRPVLGGNASSEIRMWICGARGENLRETGILEEIELENLYRNPDRNFSLRDSILYEKARFTPGITLLLNTTCHDAQMQGRQIAAVHCWGLTNETRYVVKAKHFIDCSGDGILAPLSGAEFRYGREAFAEFGEDIAPPRADDNTMGMSCLLQARQTDSPKPFLPPRWANVYASDEDLPHRRHTLGEWDNFWWLELGGTRDTIHDTEEIRDELLQAAFGVWDHIKNRGDHGAENWELEWVGFLPGKRESRRLIGDHILTQQDVRSGGPFEDIIAYGGWPMDDHHPAGLLHPGEPTIFHPAPSPFGIPYRCVYSRNVENLLFAGRNISATHAAMSSTRVMATCAILGQAAGTAAALACENRATPRQIGQGNLLRRLQQMLMADDCYLPGLSREISPICTRAELTASRGDPEPLRNGVDRPVGQYSNAWEASPGDWVEYRFPSERALRRIRLVFDSDLNRQDKNIPCRRPLSPRRVAPPATLAADFDIEIQRTPPAWETLLEVRDNYQRLVRIPRDTHATAIRLKLRRTWGNPRVRLFGFEVE